MTARNPHLDRATLLEALAEFRYHLRSFLQFSEQVAQDHHLHPRQHQLLLQIVGIRDGRAATIGYLAERLGLRQNSLVELADRSVAEGLVRRAEDPADRRRVVLSATRKGVRVLNALSASHAREMDEFGPRLLRALERIRTLRVAPDGAGASKRSPRAAKWPNAALRAPVLAAPGSRETAPRRKR